MHIRSATADDIAAMRRIEAQSATAAHWSDEQYNSLFLPEPRRVSLVLEDGGVQAFLIARPAGGEWDLENIAVAPAVRRRGLGAALLRHFLDLVRREGGDSILLEVRASNQAARALYGKWGFVETGRRRGYYSHPAEDAIVYRLSFPGPKKR